MLRGVNDETKMLLSLDISKVSLSMFQSTSTYYYR